MEQSTTPPQGKDNVLARVRKSARFVQEHARDVRINSAAIASFVDGLDMEQFHKNAAVVRFPLSFASVEDEANFWGILDMLNFGSGYRHLLHAAHQQGAYDTIVRGALSMYISGAKLDASYLEKINTMDISSNFGIPLYEDKPLQEGFTYISTPTALLPLGKYIQQALNEAAVALKAQGCQSIGQWIMRTLTPKSPESGPVSAAEFVAKLVETFPAFRDKATYDGEEVYILKKAQLLAADLNRLLGSKDERFKFPDINELTVFSDNVLPAVLRKYGILELSQSLAEHVDSKRDLEPGPQEIELRCVAIAASEDVLAVLKAKRAAEVGEDLNAMILDYFLWTQGKAEGFRIAERHYTKATYYY